MSLDISLHAMRKVEIFEENITHNLVDMAKDAGIYTYLWRPEEIGIIKAKQLIEPLWDGLQLLKSDRARFEAFNPTNGWGSYDILVEVVEKYLDACRNDPDAIVSVSR